MTIKLHVLLEHDISSSRTDALSILGIWRHGCWRENFWGYVERGVKASTAMRVCVIQRRGKGAQWKGGV